MSESTGITIAAPLSVGGMDKDVSRKLAAFHAELQRNVEQIAAVLPPGIDVRTLCSTVLAVAADNPQLVDCTPYSLIRSVFKAATLGLQLGQTCDIVPVKKKGVLTAECWVRVRGVVELAINARAIQWGKFGAICDGDTWSFEDESLKHRPTSSPKADGSNVSHVYAMIILMSGQKVYEVWAKDRIIAHRDKYAKGVTYPDGNANRESPWNKDPLPMWGKTVMKAALRFAPLSASVRGVISDGDEIAEAAYEIVDPTQALDSASGALEALDRLGSGAPITPVMTLTEAEAVLIPGKPEAWGGHGGAQLVVCKDALLQQVVKWVTLLGPAERADKFARLRMACEIVLEDRLDAVHSDALESAA